MVYSKVYLEITNICNKNCSFCHGTKRPPEMLTIDEFEKITDKLIGVTEYLYFHLMGEPLLHPDLEQFIKSATAKGFKVAITTNGTLLASQKDMLINSGVYKISISLHSFEQGSEDEFSDYINSAASFAKQSSDAGILTVFRLWNEGHDGGRNAVILDMLRSCLQGEWKEGGKGYRIKNKLHLEFGERFSWPDSDIEDISNSVFCYGLKDHFGILVDGTVVPCCLDSEGNIPLGNILKDDINMILRSERATNIRQGFINRKPSENLCRKCGYATRF